ncbi:MAG: DUF1540 domain-containing protein [Candidatus Nanopelagicales bacterium]
MPIVAMCTVDGCSYNHDASCHAFAITIGAENAHCDTFIEIPLHGGLPLVTTRVGACHRADCTHNSELECSADDIKVGPGRDVADCLTYSAA